MNSEATRTVVLAGGTGFLGSILSDYFNGSGWTVVILSRRNTTNSQSRDDISPATRVRHVQWDGNRLGRWVDVLNGSNVLINLAGRSVNCRFTAENRKQILQSRMDATKVLGQAISNCDKPPGLWLNCSGVGIYNQSFNKDIDESSRDFSEAESATSFMGNVAWLWERALSEANTPRTRKVALRISMVLGARTDSAFAVLRRLAKLGLAGTLGSGKQIVSWIHERDFCRALDWIIHHPDIGSAVNITAPEPVTNAEFMRSLRRACGNPVGLPAPAWALKIGAFFTRTQPELILDSRRVVPARLLASGFKFDFPKCESALRDLAARPLQDLNHRPI